MQNILAMWYKPISFFYITNYICLVVDLDMDTVWNCVFFHFRVFRVVLILVDTAHLAVQGPRAFSVNIKTEKKDAEFFCFWHVY